MRLHLDDAGQPAGSLTFDAWGTPTVGSPDPFGFAGEMHLGGLQYLRARWYDPSSGVFTSRDPFAGFEQQPYSLHPYQYGYAAPTMWTDPSGELAIFVAGRGSENRGHDPLGNQAALVSIWEMGARFANSIGGPTIIASWNATKQIEEAIQPFVDQCRNEPLILVGHSLGGSAVMEIALNTEARIDLLVTMDMAYQGAEATYVLALSKPENVRRHINFVSDSSVHHPDYDMSNGLVKGVVGVVEMVPGAETVVVTGATHNTLDHEFLDAQQTILNPVWIETEKAMSEVMASFRY